MSGRMDGNGKNGKTPMTLEAVRTELSTAKGKKYWRSVDELGHFLVDRYKIRTPKDLTSCEVCHR